MGYPVHKYLEEFSVDDARLSDIVRALRPRSQPDPEQAIIARVEESHARGYEDGHAAARAIAAAQLDAVRADYEDRIEQSKALFSEALAEKLAGELRRQIDAVHITISDQLVTALLPVMRHVLTDASVRELAGSLNDLLSGTDALTIELRGPKELIDRVTARLSEMENPEIQSDASRIKCISDETTELKVAANDTVIEARLSNWIKRISAAVE